ncbi:MAG: autotransporter outer membrane beta-barrel domain-containing protein [Rickettsiales bacterium]|jgi:outer membrane autotransporter protein|nr:autotransporter outer membrane beta-barrel domain-containing protein [Rickettsiales bacterium]
MKKLSTTLISLLALICANPAIADTTADVAAGATSDDSVVEGAAGDYSIQNVYGTTNNAVVNSYGQQIVRGGGVANASAVAGTQSVQAVLLGGAANNTQILADGTQQVFGTLGGNTTIGTGGLQILGNGFSFADTSSKITIDGGIQYIGYLNSGGGWNETQNLTAAQASQFDFKSGTQRIQNNSTIGGDATNHLTIGDGTGIAKQYIIESSAVTNAVVKNNSLQYVDNGTATGTVVEAGGMQNVSTNGTGTDTMVGGTQLVYGTAAGTTVKTGGSQVVQASGTASGTIIAGGEQDVWGVLAGSTILNSGRQFLLSNAELDSGATIVINGGRQVLGSVNDDNIIEYSHDLTAANSAKITMNGGEQFINKGSSAAGMTIKGTDTNNKGTQTVNGSAANTTVDAWGIQNVNSFSSATESTVKTNGVQNVYANSIVTNTTIDGGTQNVYVGATAAGTTVNSGGEQILRSNAAASGTIVNSGGLATVNRGGTISGATVNAGGTMTLSGSLLFSGSLGNLVLANTTASNTALAGGTMDMSGSSYIYNGTAYGSVANDTVITNGGVMNVGASGSRNATANDTTITDGRQNVYGTLGGLARIGANGVQNLYGASIASGANIIIDGGVQNLESGAYSGGRISFVSGTQNVKSGASVSNMDVSSATSAAQNVYGSASGSTIGLHGTQTVHIGGTASLTKVNNGGTMNVSGTAANTAVNNGGVMNLKSGSSISGVNNAVNNGGISNIESGANIGSSSAYFAVNSGGVMNVNAGAVANFMKITGGTQNVAGSASNTTINGGIQKVAVGGLVKGATTVNSGGVQEILDGAGIGTDTGDLITISGGTQRIGASGTAATVTAAGAAKIKMSYGSQVVENGAVEGMAIAGLSASQTGVQTVSASGSASSTSVGAFGVQNVWGSVSNTVVGAGGVLRFMSATAVFGGANNRIDSGGAVLFDAASISGSGATLTLGGGRMALNGVSAFDANFAVRGNGIIDLTLRSGNNGADSDLYEFGDIDGTFSINLLYSIWDAAALNSLDSIDIVRNNSADKTAATFSALNNGIDVGLYNWDVVTDGMTGITTAVKTERASTLLSNTLNHAHSIKSVVEKLSNSMHKRVGELQWLDGSMTASSGGASKSGIWARGIFKSSAMEAGGKADMNLRGAEFGYDFKAKNSGFNKIFIGFMGYAASGSAEFKTANPDSDTSDIGAFGAGLYGIWLGAGGWFADAALRAHFISQDVTAYAAGSPVAIKFDSSHTAASVNLDFGREFVFGAAHRLAWFLTPHMQFNGAYISGADFEVSAGQAGKIDASFNMQASLGAITGPRWTLGGGGKLQLYAKAGYVADLSDDTAVNFSGLNVSDKFRVGGIEFGGGLNYRAAGKRLSAYLDAMSRIGDDYDEFGGIVGMRYEF